MFGTRRISGTHYGATSFASLIGFSTTIRETSPSFPWGCRIAAGSEDNRSDARANHHRWAAAVDDLTIAS
jgi:hypothetical protein